MENEVFTESANSIHLYRVLEDEYISLYGPLPDEYPWLFLQSHIKDRPSLIARIKDGKTPLTAYFQVKLYDLFSRRVKATESKIAVVRNPETKADFEERLAYLKELKTLPAYGPSDPAGKGLLDALVDIFNEILPQQDFYSEALFADVDLQDETKRFVAEYLKKTGPAAPSKTLICRINRFLLEDAFPDEIEGRDLDNLDAAHRSYIAAIHSAIHKRERSALCLSGGGIRSATLNLGILQGLARHGLLDKFDYLSTVSGGGYIGSWLTSWIHRERGGLQAVAKKLSQKPASALQPEPQPIQHLRAYSNYLSPKLGLLSADTWTLAAIVTRNLLLNWLVFIPLLAAVLIVPRLYVSALTESARTDWIPAMLVIAFVAKAIAIGYLARTLPSSGKRNNTPRQFLFYGLTPLVVSVALLTLVWSWANWSGYDWRLARSAARTIVNLDKLEVIVPSVLMGLFGCAVYFGARFSRHYNPNKRNWWQILLMMLGAAGLGSVASGLVGFFIWQRAEWRVLNPVHHPHLFACLAVPLLLTLYALGGTLIAGLTSRWTEEDDQEWWARCGAWILIVTFSWAVVTLLVVFGPQLPAMLRWPQRWSDWKSAATAMATALGVLSGVITLLGGFSSGTPAHRRHETSNGTVEATEEKTSVLHKITPLAAPAFFAFIIVLISLGTNWLLISFASFVRWLAFIGNSASETLKYWFVEMRFVVVLRSLLADVPSSFQLRSGVDNWLAHQSIIWNTPFRLILTVWILLIVFGWIMARVINTNMFSIHSLYGNRLKRAYLGASRSKRSPHMFTGFDSTDNIQMHALRPEVFDRDSFADLRSLIYKIKQPNPDDSLSIYLREKLSPDT